MTVSTLAPKGNIGHKIERIRELKGIKQESLATAIGVTQQAISKIEQSETVDDEKLKKIADALGVSIEAIKNYNEDAVLSLIQNNNDSSTNNFLIGYQYNPVEKIVELYERMLKEKDEIIEMYKKQQKAS